MQIEVVGFYPNSKKSKGGCIGTLHIYLVDLDMDVRGVCVVKNGSKYYFFLPQRLSTDGTNIRYPVMNFTNVEKHKAFVKDLRAVGTAFMIEEEKVKKASPKGGKQ